MKRVLFLLVAFWVAVACRKQQPSAVEVDAGLASPPRPSFEISTVGPRLLSNQTSNPLSVTGRGLKTGMKLDVGGLTVVLTALDDGHAFGRLPPGMKLPADQFMVFHEVKVDGVATGLKLKVVNDTAFPVLGALAVNGAKAYVASSTEDVVYAVDLATKQVSAIAVGDGPSALAAWRDGVAVVHRYSPEVKLIAADGSVMTLPGPAYAAAALTAGDVLYVAEHTLDTVSALDLSAEAKELWRTPVAPNPGTLALTAKGLAVGSQQTGELELVDPKTGKVLTSVEPGPGTPIAGPPTLGGDGPELAKYTMNGSMPRALAYSAKQSALFNASIGPNIGPNPKKMEVSMNGGVAVVAWDKETPLYLRHLGLGGGVTQALALDDARGLLYGADVALGLVRVLDTRKLASKSAGDVNQALLQEVALEPPSGFPLIRDPGDFAVKGRAGTALHSGPSALALSPDAKTLYVLNRFTGTLARLDVSKAPAKGTVVVDQLPITKMLAQASRRKGEVLYFADLGRSAVTCDSCHPDGHTGGLMFEKTMPLRIYRSGTVRGALETAPYFTPASTHSMAQTAKFVMERNRFSNPEPSPQEIEDVSRYMSAIVTLPNPFAGADGAPPEALTLPDGKVSHPRRGMLLFEGKAQCAGCHPAPQFTTDQDAETRGRYLDVGTPHLTPLREELQNPTFKGFAPPALVGAWDIFPMLTTGLAGLRVDGERLVVDTRFPLRKAVRAWAPQHGRADLLTDEELDDLLGYVQSL
ncbi:MAG: MtsA protein [Myxococcaceae bacterium]|nr:MtsA protein [Myxococcaceae bacterium]